MPGRFLLDDARIQYGRVGDYTELLTEVEVVGESQLEELCPLVLQPCPKGDYNPRCRPKLQVFNCR